MSDLRISETLSLPLDFVTARVSLVGMSGAGKSNAFADMIEEVEKARGLFTLIDPLGAAWGMRSNAAGDGPGLPVPIFGGYHADVSITATSGALVARELYHADASGIIDLSALGPEEACLFFAEMTHAFLALHRKQKKPRAYFVDEAALLMPERQSSKAETAALDAGWRMHTGGRAMGLGMKTATQSAAEQAKRTMKQSELFVALRTFAPIDQKPILDYLRTSVEPDRANEIKRTLAKLQDGEAWFIAPHWLGIVERARFRLRETFDSARTPRVGEVITEPKVLAAVDLARISAAIAATEEPAAAEPSDDKPALDHTKALRAALAERDRARVQRDQVVSVVQSLASAMRLASGTILAALEGLTLDIERINDDIGAPPSTTTQSQTTEGPVGTTAVVSPQRPAASAKRTSRPADGSGEPGRDAPQVLEGGRRILAALARCGGVLTKAQARTLADITSGRTFQNYTLVLRQRGFIDEPDRSSLRVTPAGAAFIDVAIRNSPPRSDEIVAMYAPRLLAGARKMLDLLVAAYPNTIGKHELRLRAGVESERTFQNYLLVLRKNGLAEDAGRSAMVAGNALFINGGKRR